MKHQAAIESLFATVGLEPSRRNDSRLERYCRLLDDLPRDSVEWAVEHTCRTYDRPGVAPVAILRTHAQVHLRRQQPPAPAIVPTPKRDSPEAREAAETVQQYMAAVECPCGGRIGYGHNERHCEQAADYLAACEEQLSANSRRNRSSTEWARAICKRAQNGTIPSRNEFAGIVLDRTLDGIYVWWIRREVAKAGRLGEYEAFANHRAQVAAVQGMFLED